MLGPFGDSILAILKCWKSPTSCGSLFRSPFTPGLRYSLCHLLVWMRNDGNLHLVNPKIYSTWWEYDGNMMGIWWGPHRVTGLLQPKSITINITSPPARAEVVPACCVALHSPTWWNHQDYCALTVTSLATEVQCGGFSFSVLWKVWICLNCWKDRARKKHLLDRRKDVLTWECCKHGELPCIHSS